MLSNRDNDIASDSHNDIPSDADDDLISGTKSSQSEGLVRLTGLHFHLNESNANSSKEQNIRKADNEAWRYILPFFLLVSVLLFALFRFLGSAADPTPYVCPEDSIRYTVKVGDSCWAIANGHSVKVADLMRLNYGMDCSLLKAGREICVPASE
jgi:LysM repeat protein